MFIKLLCEGVNVYREFLELKIVNVLFELWNDKISNVKLNWGGKLIEMRKIYIKKANL